jgi:predicted DNA-binding transcriptional regulator AlpA
MSGDEITDEVRVPTLPEIKRQWPPTVDVPAAARAFGVSRSHAYELVNRGEFPAKVIKVGSRYRVVTESIIRVLSDELK